MFYTQEATAIHEYSTLDIKRKHNYNHIFKIFHAHETYHRDDLLFISLLAQQKLQHIQIGLITLLWIKDVTYALLYQTYI